MLPAISSVPLTKVRHVRASEKASPDASPARNHAVNMIFILIYFECDMRLGTSADHPMRQQQMTVSERFR